VHSYSSRLPNIGDQDHGHKMLWFVRSQCDKANKLPSLIVRCWHVLLMVQLFKSLLHSEQFFYCSGYDLLVDYHLIFDFNTMQIFKLCITYIKTTCWFRHNPIFRQMLILCITQIWIWCEGPIIHIYKKVIDRNFPRIWYNHLICNFWKWKPHS